MTKDLYGLSEGITSRSTRMPTAGAVDTGELQRYTHKRRIGMRIEIESTEKIVELSGVPARVWDGKTDSGIPVHCFVTRISPQTHENIE